MSSDVQTNMVVNMTFQEDNKQLENKMLEVAEPFRRFIPKYYQASELNKKLLELTKEIFSPNGNHFLCFLISNLVCDDFGLLNNFLIGNKLSSHEQQTKAPLGVKMDEKHKSLMNLQWRRLNDIVYESVCEARLPFILIGLLKREIDLQFFSRCRETFTQNLNNYEKWLVSKKSKKWRKRQKIKTKKVELLEEGEVKKVELVEEGKEEKKESDYRLLLEFYHNPLSRFHGFSVYDLPEECGLSRRLQHLKQIDALRQEHSRRIRHLDTMTLMKHAIGAASNQILSDRSDINTWNEVGSYHFSEWNKLGAQFENSCHQLFNPEKYPLTALEDVSDFFQLLTEFHVQVV